MAFLSFDYIIVCRNALRMLYGVGYDFGVENVGDFSAVEIKLVKNTTNFLFRKK
jgi:hypothetical protein